MARGFPESAGRPGPAKTGARGARIRPLLGPPEAARSRVDRMRRPPEQACDDSPYEPPGQPEPDRQRSARPRASGRWEGDPRLKGDPRSDGARTRRTGVRPGHLGHAVRPGRVPPLRGARGRAAARGDHRAGGQAPPPGTGLVRPAVAADAGRAAHQARPPRPAGADQRPRRHAARRAQPLRRPGAAAGVPQRVERRPDPFRGAQPGRRGPRRHAREQGHAAAGQGRVGRPRRRRVPPRPGQRSDVDRHGRGRRLRGTGQPAVRGRDGRRRRHGRAALPHRPGAHVHPRLGAGAHAARQVGAARARRPRGVRPARPVRGAADRAGPPDRRLDRHRLARRARRHRQVGSRAVRGPRGGHGAPQAQAR